MPFSVSPPLPRHMKAIVPRTGGGPEVIELVERPVPIAQPGQVLIRTAYAGVNRHDCNQRQRGIPPVGSTDILGLEVSGTVVAVGDGVSAELLSQQVCALVDGGGYADYALAEAGLTLPMPKNLDLATAAALPEAIFTAWFNLVELCTLRSGETVLVHGGASGVGLIAIQLARTLGAEVYATAGSAERGAICVETGATAAFNYREEDFVAELLRASNERGADVIIDMAGGQYAERNLRALAPDGRIAHLSSGKQPTYSVPLSLLMQKRARIMGGHLRALPLPRKLAIADRLRKEVWPMVGSRITPIVDQVFPLQQAEASHFRMEAGLNAGKMLLATGQ